jgi:carbonic anhydrase
VAAVVEHDHDHGPAERLTAVEQASVEHSLANLRTFPWIRVRESKEQLTLHGAWFDISQGELNVYVEPERRWTVA